MIEINTAVIELIVIQWNRLVSPPDQTCPSSGFQSGSLLNQTLD
jgi:hypothetical protein